MLHVKLSALKPSVTTLAPSLRTPAATVRVRGSALQRRRSQLLRENPLCHGPDSECERNGIIRPWQERDHIVPLHLGGSDDTANEQGLCRECHAKKSAREASERSGGRS